MSALFSTLSSRGPAAATAWPRLGALRRLRGFRGAEMLFSLKSFGAAMLAFYVASEAGLPRPFWAVLTTYVVASPFAGNVRSKALFRFCGTFIGCAVTVLLVPALANAPELLTLALALWVGLCLYMALQDRTARSYVFMLAGYTAALIGFPSVATPDLVFDTALARVEEIGIGILCATFVHSLVFPAGLKTSVMALLDHSLGDARQWFADVLAPLHRDGVPSLDRQRLAADITQLRLLSTHVPFDTTHLRWAAGALGALQDRLAALTPALSAAEDRLLALADERGRLPADVTGVLAETAAWLEAGALGGDDLQRLRTRLRGLGEDAATPPLRRALRISLAVRLEELAQGWRDCASLRAVIDAGSTGSSDALRHAGLANRVLHRDTGLALLSSVAAVIAICLCSAAWITTAWPSGSVAPMMAAVFCSFFANLDDPVPAINGFLKFTLVSVPISAVYVLVLLPMVNDFGMLALICAPVLLFLGCLIARPTTTAAAMATTFGVLGTLALRDTASADFASFINSNLAQVAGIGAAALVTKSVRTVGADWSAARIRRATWREIARIAAAPSATVDADTYAVRMLDRIALLAPRIATVDAVVRGHIAQDALRDLRSGADVVALQGVQRRLPRLAIGDLMQGVSRLFRGRRAQDMPAAPALLAQIDNALAAALAGSSQVETVESTDLRTAVTALVGLRRNLFPSASSALVAGAAA